MDNAQKITALFVLAITGYIFYHEGGINTIQNKLNPKPDTVYLAPVHNSNPEKDNCKCSIGDVEGLASKIVSDFTLSQREVSSEMARVMSTYGPPEKRDNCTWVVMLKISWPFGDTDGQHPDEFIKKRIACDGKEVYVQ